MPHQPPGNAGEMGMPRDVTGIHRDQVEAWLIAMRAARPS